MPQYATALSVEPLSLCIECGNSPRKAFNSIHNLPVKAKIGTFSRFVYPRKRQLLGDMPDFHDTLLVVLVDLTVPDSPEPLFHGVSHHLYVFTVRD